MRHRSSCDRTNAGAGKPSALIGDRRERPPFLPYLFALYRTDGKFHALVDLAIVGALTLSFTLYFGNTSRNVLRPDTSGQTAPVNPASPSPASPVGKMTLESASLLTIPESVFEAAPPAIKPALRAAMDARSFERGEAMMAHLRQLDQTEPSVAYSVAVATVLRATPDAGVDALRRLRTATRLGYAPAFTLYGIILLRIAVLDEMGALPTSQRATIDGAENKILVSRTELLKEAVQWWQRAQALGDPVAGRFLGMVEGQGMLGPVNLPNAHLHFQEAARRGDPMARYEVGMMYVAGLGVQANNETAVRHLRDAVASGLLEARLALASQLLTLVAKGDHQAGDEARASLVEYILRSRDTKSVGLAYMLLGLFHDIAAAPGRRDPERAVAYWHAGAALDDVRSKHLLVRSYRTGVGVIEDRPHALAMMRELAVRDKSVAADVKSLEAQLTPGQLARAATIRLDFGPPDFARARLMADGLSNCRRVQFRFAGVSAPPHPGLLDAVDVDPKSHEWDKVASCVTSK